MAFARPWGIGPLGRTIYEDYGVDINVQATGFYPVLFSYCPMNLQDCVSKEGVRVSVLNDGLLLFEMQRVDGTHSSTQTGRIEPSQVIYHTRLNREPLTRSQLQMLIAGIDQEPFIGKDVWFVRVIANHRAQLKAIIYFIPDIVSERIRKGDYAYYEFDPELTTIARQMGREVNLKAKRGKYCQVSPKTQPFTTQTSIPSQDSMLPFPAPHGFLEHEIAEIVDFLRSAPKERTKTEFGVFYVESGIDLSLPITRIAEEGEIIKVRTGTQEGPLAGMGQYLEIKKTPEGYELIRVGEWVS